MTHAPTDALRLVPTRDDGLRVGRAILEAHSQWEKEHGVTGAQNPWQEQHIILLGQAAILAAPASPLPGGGWQDISTAPKDGTLILCLYPERHGHDRYSLRYWSAGDWPSSGRSEGWCDQHRQLRKTEPTHWMPLPAAPTGEQK